VPKVGISPHYLCGVSIIEAPEHIQNLLKTLPGSPGVYQYFDIEGKLIYVGKAKDLRKRVSSYFTKDRYDSRKTALLVRKIVDIKHIVVDSELDALLLENNLIKQYQPRYNVLLKDDKTYPWICIKKEPFPRIFPTRNVVKDGSLYFGPYASVKDDAHPARPHPAALSATHLFVGAYAEEHQGREVQGVSRISYRQLQRPMRWRAGRGRL
jgi:hypothetical protein